MPANFPSEATQWSVVKAGYDSALFSILLTGIYTCVYIGTIYIYLTSNVSCSRFVIATLTGLYVFNLVQTAMQWVILTKLLGLIGEPLIVSFLFVKGLTPWIQTLNNTMLMLTSTLADALLIWRCYYIWDNSLPVIAVPSVLLLAEFSLYMFLTVNARVQGVSVRTNNARITGAAAFLTFSTTLICTILIIHRIYSSHKEGRFLNKKKFNGIVEPLIQSAAVYAAAAFVFAVARLLVARSEFHETWWALSAYSYPLYLSFAGIAPTIMIAQNAMEFSKPVKNPVTARISDLEFGRGRSTGFNHTGHVTLESTRIHAINTNSLPPGQGDEKSKPQEPL